MSNEKFNSIQSAMDFFSKPQCKNTPATVIWPMVAEIPAEAITTTKEGDWLVNLGLQLVQSLSRFTEEDLQRIDLNLDAIATKTEEIRHKFHRPIFKD